MPAQAGDPHHCRQSLRAQDPSRARFPGSASTGAAALHTDLFVMAQPGRDLVRQDRARRDRRGIFTSVPDLARKLRRYINAYSANAKPIQWKYSDASRRVRSNELTATSFRFADNPTIS